MIASDIIQNSFPSVEQSHTLSVAAEISEDLGVYTIPVVEAGVFRGYITEEILLNESHNKKISHIALFGEEWTVLESEHFLDICKRMMASGLWEMAVVDADLKYKGLVTDKDLIRHFGRIGFVASPGGILVLRMRFVDFTMTEISRIVESNDMKILCMYVSNISENQELEVTLKLNKLDLSRLISSFERYGYKIVADFHETAFQQYDTHRLEFLLKYLNI